MEEQGVNKLICLKTDDFEVEYDILPVCPMDPRRIEIYRQIDSIDERLALVQQRVDELNNEIDRLTNHADGLDYMVAVASGVLTGLIDSFIVGETNIDVDKIQKKLEERYHTANDPSYKHKTIKKDNDEGWVSSAKLHRLEDLAHHPTMLGLIAAILVRFFRIAIFSNGDGKTHSFFIEKNPNTDTFKKEIQEMCVAWSLAVLSGVLVWLANVANTKYKDNIGEDIPAPLRKLIHSLAAAPAIIDIMLAADTWIGHIMSDVSTSAGVPGIILSVLKEMSMLPGINKTKLPEIVQELYTSEKMNISNYAGVVFTAIKKQSIPIVINEVLVRGFYFVRRLIIEYKDHNNFKDINWRSVIPFQNRTIVRMMTIASGTFTAVDMADAAIRSAAKSEGNGAVFAKEFILRVNFVGVGRFAIAVGADIKMGIDRHRRESERMQLNSEMIMLTNAKVFYKEADMWISAQDAGQEINKVYSQMNDVAQSFATSFHETEQDLDSLTDDVMADFRENNAEATQEFLDILES